jgi:hypothetical protein
VAAWEKYEGEGHFKVARLMLRRNSGRIVDDKHMVCTCVVACIALSTWLDPGRDHGDGIATAPLPVGSTSLFSWLESPTFCSVLLVKFILYTCGYM